MNFKSRMRLGEFLALACCLIASVLAQQNGSYTSGSNYNQTYSYSLAPNPCNCVTNVTQKCPWGYQYYDSAPYCRPIDNPCAKNNTCPPDASCIYEPGRCPNGSDYTCKRYSCVQECVNCFALPRCTNYSCSAGQVCREIPPTCTSCGSVLCECPPKNVCLSCPEPVCNYLCREGYECKIQSNECFRCGYAKCVPRNVCVECAPLPDQCLLQCPYGYKCSVADGDCYRCPYQTCIKVDQNDTCLVCENITTCRLPCRYGYECKVVPSTCTKCAYRTCVAIDTPTCVSCYLPKCPSDYCDTNELCRIVPGNCTHCPYYTCVPNPRITPYNPYSPYSPYTPYP